MTVRTKSRRRPGQLAVHPFPRPTRLSCRARLVAYSRVRSGAAAAAAAEQQARTSGDGGRAGMIGTERQEICNSSGVPSQFRSELRRGLSRLLLKSDFEAGSAGAGHLTNK